MPLLRQLPRAENAVELLDAPPSTPDLEETLSDISRLNHWFGGARVTRLHLVRLLGAPRAERVTVLDVGSGGADIPIRLVRWARRRGISFRVIALDRERRILEVARRRAAAYPEISFVQADALHLPVRGGGVDAAISSLTLHHLEPDVAPGLLAEMGRVSRRGFVVNDLMRSRVAYGLVWLATRLFAWNRMSRHDGPLSVRRAYSAREIRSLAERAGVSPLRIVRHPLWLRLAVVGYLGGGLRPPSDPSPLRLRGQSPRSNGRGAKRGLPCAK
ncbi:MAG: methyltransferase domain-containing protein [Candidatus Rokubacteria bacterium]|nr:methyltransferase domain-containing protein [Candidatus Rokubacteria bacterium]